MATLDHRHLEPLVPSSAPPLLVLLHGIGANMDDLLPLGHMLDPAYRVVAAQAPIDMTPMGMPGGRAWFPLFFGPEGYTFDHEQAMAGARAASDFVRHVADHLPCDPERVHVLGFSQGAMMTHAMLLEDTAPVSAAMCCSGRMIDDLFTPDRDLSHLAGRSIFISHGRQDDVIPVDSGRAIRDYYAASPTDVAYHEYDMAHDIGPECLEDLRAWVGALAPTA